MPTLFTKIINQEIPSYKIYEDDYTYVFLTIQPMYTWHTLVVPKVEVDKWYNNHNEILHKLMDTAKHIAKDLEVIFEAERVAMIIEWLEVPHTHLHLVPLPESKWLKDSETISASDKQLQKVHLKITNYLDWHK